MKLSVTITTQVSQAKARDLISDGGRTALLSWLIAVCASDAPGTTLKFTTSRTIELGEPTLFDALEDEAAVEQEVAA